MAVPLPTLFTASLSNASKSFLLPTVDDSTQGLIRSSLTDLTTLRSRIAGLSLFSPNEVLEDISTRDLVYLFVPYVCAEIRGRVRTTEREERMVSLDQTQKDLHAFLSYLEDYEIVPEEERALYKQKASMIADPAKKREVKIKQYQKEKLLRVRIEEVRKRRGQFPFRSDSASSDFDLISSLLPSPSRSYSSTAPDDDEEPDSETDDILREATILLLRLCYAQAHCQLESMERELELLRTAPPSPSRSSRTDDRRGKARESENDMWKLDASQSNMGLGGTGPLLDSSGKPLRPFTILPAGAADRARFQGQVFGPGHNLPTMSIDQYLQIERERGNILSGGGPASRAEPTSSEQLALEAEMDGTREGEEKVEQKRLKDENWARYTDENPRGAGNTMNRG
ncbi:serine/threonine protein phosphatase PP2A-associated protein [Tricholoma matsutake]|nr:serine/threonine protein phosphatase PP2A-associated protein [Tricholoma matsutake 945]